MICSSIREFGELGTKSGFDVKIQLTILHYDPEFAEYNLIRHEIDIAVVHSG